MQRNNGLLAIGSMLMLLIVGILIVVLALWAWPNYQVYRLELNGEAELREAEWTKKILIEEAKAREEAALLQARAQVTLAEARSEALVIQARAEGAADIERAKATAEANRIIGESLKGNEEYLQYIWIIGLQDSSGERIYIPTEAGLPILEAGK